MEITTMSKEAVRQIQEEVKAALAGMVAAHGLVMGFKAGSYDPTGGECTLKVTFRCTTTADGIEQAAANFARDAALVGLKAEDYGRIITYGGKQYKVRQIILTSSRFQVLVDRVPDGKGFKLPAYAVEPSLPRRQF